MIELDIKIRAKDQRTVKLFTDLMITGLSAANEMNQVDVSLFAEKDGDTITLTRTEIIENANLTPIDVFIKKANDLPVRIINALKSYDVVPGGNPVYHFVYAEDISRIKFLRHRNVSVKSWRDLKKELIKQNIKFKE